MRKPLSRPFKDERPNKKAVFGNRKLILSYVVKKEKAEEVTPCFSPATLS